MMMLAFVAAGMIAGSHAFPGGTSERSAPKVVSTYPAQGATIKPGWISLSVTFDQSMQPDSYSFV